MGAGTTPSDDYRISGAAKQALAVLDGAGEPLEPGVIAERRKLLVDIDSAVPKRVSPNRLRTRNTPADRRCLSQAGKRIDFARNLPCP
jgi:hypothetical protein